MHQIQSLVIFATLLVSTLGAEPASNDHGQDSESVAGDSDKDSSPGIKFEDVCYFAFPSFACTRKCEGLGKLPYCHDTEKRCLCRERDALLEPLENDSNLTSSDGIYYKKGKVMNMEDYCIFGQIPSLKCRAKCELNNLQSYCSTGSRNCLCKRPGAVTPTPPPQDDYCWFGEWPSTACHRKCDDRGGAYCVINSTTNECRCKEETQIETPDVTTGRLLETPETQDAETQTETPMQRLFVLINFGGGLFGLNGGEGEKEGGSDEEWEGEDEEEDEEEEGEEEEECDHNDDELFAFIGFQSTASPEAKLAHTGSRPEESRHGISRDQLWTLQALTASGIIVILLVLLALELYLLFARKRSSKGLAHVFNSLPTTKT